MSILQREVSEPHTDEKAPEPCHTGPRCDDDSQHKAVIGSVPASKKPREACNTFAQAHDVLTSD